MFKKISPFVLLAIILASPITTLIQAVPAIAEDAPTTNLSDSADIVVGTNVKTDSEFKDALVKSNTEKAANMAKDFQSKVGTATGQKATPKVKGTSDSAVAKYYVELDEPAAQKEVGLSDGSAKYVKKAHRAANKKILNQKTIKDQLDSNVAIGTSNGYLINGFSVTASSAEVKKIKKIKGVKAVTRVNTYKLADNSSNSLSYLTDSVQNQAGLAGGKGTVIAIIDAGIDAEHVDFKLDSAEGDTPGHIKGEKIDADQAAKFISKEEGLGYGVWRSDKIPFSYDYSNKTTDSSDYTEGHGTHVAGIAAANGDTANGGIKGAAPQAQLLDLKINANASQLAVATDLVRAVEDAVTLGADAINISMTMGENSTQSHSSPELIAIQKAAAAGVVPVIAAGNDGLFSSGSAMNDFSLFNTVEENTTQSPGTALDAITVASYNNTNVMQVNATGSVNDTKRVTFDNIVASDSFKALFAHETSIVACANFVGSDPKAKIVSPGWGQVIDTADSFEKTIKGVEIDAPTAGLPGYMFMDDIAKTKEKTSIAGKVMVTTMNPLNPDLQLAMVNEENIKGLIIISDLSDDELDKYPAFDAVKDVALPYAVISREDGQKLMAALSKDGDNTLEIDPASWKINPSAKADNGGRMTGFSGWGLNPELDFNPDISTPGNNIYSTWNQEDNAENNNHKVDGGTSMATPQVAGAVALIVSNLKKLATEHRDSAYEVDSFNLTKDAKLALTTTAQPKTYKVGDSTTVYSPRKQGSGAMNVQAAVNNKTKAVVVADDDSNKELGGNFALKAFTEKTRTFKVKLTNNGSDPVTYNFDDHGGVYTQERTTSHLRQYKNSLPSEGNPLSKPGFGDYFASLNDVPIEGATITTDLSDNQFTLGTDSYNKTKLVTITITLPASFESQSWVEGFAGFAAKNDASTKQDVDLVIPYAGFYGDYNEENSIDQPLWDSAEKTGNTYIGTCFGNDPIPSGMQSVKDEYFYETMFRSTKSQFYSIDPSKVGITNKDLERYSNSLSTINFFTVRNAEDAALSVVDDKGNVVADINKWNHLEKGKFISTEHSAWNGTKYNPSTRNDDPLPEGQYYYQITNYTTYDSAKEHKQVTKLPIKIDNTGPSVTAEIVKKDGKYYLTGTLSDGAGVGISPDKQIGLAFDDGTAYGLDLDSDAKDEARLDAKTVHFNIHLSDFLLGQSAKNGVNNFRVLGTDAIDNTTVESYTQTLGDTSNAGKTSKNFEDKMKFQPFAGAADGGDYLLEVNFINLLSYPDFFTDPSIEIDPVADKSWTIAGTYDNDFYIWDGKVEHPIQVDPETGYWSYTFDFTTEAKRPDECTLQTTTGKTLFSFKFVYTRNNQIEFTNPERNTAYLLKDETIAANTIPGVSEAYIPFNPLDSIIFDNFPRYLDPEETIENTIKTHIHIDYSNDEPMQQLINEGRLFFFGGTNSAKGDFATTLQGDTSGHGADGTVGYAKYFQIDKINKNADGSTSQPYCLDTIVELAVRPETYQINPQFELIAKNEDGKYTHGNHDGWFESTKLWNFPVPISLPNIGTITNYGISDMGKHTIPTEWGFDLSETNGIQYNMGLTGDESDWYNSLPHFSDYVTLNNVSIWSNNLVTEETLKNNPIYKNYNEETKTGDLVITGRVDTDGVKTLEYAYGDNQEYTDVNPDADGNFSLTIPNVKNFDISVLRFKTTMKDEKTEPFVTSLQIVTAIKSTEYNLDTTGATWVKNDEGYDVYTNNPEFKIQGDVYEPAGGTKVYVNNDIILASQTHAAPGIYNDYAFDSAELANLENAFRYNFATTVNLPDEDGKGSTTHHLVTFNSGMGAEAKHELLNVHYKPAAAAVKPVITTDAPEGKLVSTEHVSVEPNSEITRYQVSTDGRANWVDFDPANPLAVSTTSPVYFKAFDIYGNESEPVKFESKNLKPHAAPSPVVSIVNQINPLYKSVAVNFPEGTSDIVKANTTFEYSTDNWLTSQTFEANTDGTFKPVTILANEQIEVQSKTRYDGIQYLITEQDFNVQNVITYSAHVQNKGWINAQNHGDIAGTTGQALRLEAVRIFQNGQLDKHVSIKTHVQNLGWQAAKSGENGTEGKGLRLEAFTLDLDQSLTQNYDIYYCAHVQNVGWQDWVKDGAIAGTSGKGLRVEAYEVQILPKGAPAPAKLK
ncbi:MAG: S8 family serine peptidase [Lactobacillales bacterium]|jgi:subtilisin family serine protease|nr:S8 family serine peptidase [Lactobacillales bacterium]